MKRAAIYALNTLLALFIAGVILATWMPAIYTSEWFQHDKWIRAHVLDDPTPAKAK